MGRKGLVQVNWNCLPSQATLGAKGSGVDTGYSKFKKGVVYGARVITYNQRKAATAQFGAKNSENYTWSQVLAA